MLKKLEAAWLLLLLFCALGATAPAQETEPYTMLSLRQVDEMMGKPGVYVIDVNEPEVYAKHHIKGAVHVTDEHLKRFLPRDKNATLIFYCAERRCTGSEMAAREAAKLGYRKVYTMPEGIFGWVNSGRPFERGAK